MGTTIAPLPDDRKISKLEFRAIAICEEAKRYRIATHEDYLEADLFLNSVLNPCIREGDELFDPLIASARATYLLSQETKKKAVGGLAAAKELVKKELNRWAGIVEERRRSEQLRLEEEARAAHAAKVEREIEAIESAGDPDAQEQIQAVLEAPDLLVLPPATIQKIPNSRDVYTVTITNLREFYRGLGDGRAAATLAKPDLGALNRLAGVLREGFNGTVPGCVATRSKAVNSRRM